MELLANNSNNTVYADAAGNIAYWHGNFIPKRNNPNYDYTMAVDGTIKATDWGGVHALNEIVQSINPANGWLQNCNATPKKNLARKQRRKQIIAENLFSIKKKSKLFNKLTFDQTLFARWNTGFHDFTSKLHMKLNKYLTSVLVSIDKSFQEFVNFDGTIICKLNKALYGTIEAARLWYEVFVKDAIKFGYHVNEVDMCVFSRIEDDGSTSVLVLLVSTVAL
jgi:hypothetical protein